MGTAVSKAIPKEKATEEINEWLDYKRIRAKKRKANEESIEDLIEAMEEGYLRFDPETKSLILELGVPLGTNEQITELKFKPRVSVGEMKPYLGKLKPGDADGRLLAYVTALTGQPTAVIDTMDSSDQPLATSIVVFFL